MKLLLISGDDESYSLVSSQVKALGFETLRYKNIYKAMDNLDEIEPAGIIINAKDFPRHWKVMAQFAGGKSPVMLLAEDEPCEEELSKARHLAVSVITGKELNQDGIDRLRKLHTPGKAPETNIETQPKKQQKFSFVFTAPGDMTLITGLVKDVSSGGLSFLPDHADILKQFRAGTEFHDCSLRAGDAILSPVCRLARKGAALTIEFVSFKNNEQEILNNYLN